MKRILFIWYLVFFPGFIFAQGFSVEKYTAHIYLSEEGYFDVVENYDLYFDAPKHGIYRNIVTKFKYKDEFGQVSKRQMFITDVVVQGDPFEIKDDLYGKTGEANFNIKIGDPKVLITGQKYYQIGYRVHNALFYIGDQVHLYWNLKPPDWQAKFYKIDFVIHTPEGAALSEKNCFVYAGDAGITQPSKRFDYTYSDNQFSGISRDRFTSQPGQSVTVLVKLPQQLITQTDAQTISQLKKQRWHQKYFWIYIILGMTGLYFLLKRIFIGGKQEVVPITSYYPPEGIDTVMAGYLIDDKGDTSDILTLLPKWGTEGVISMEEIEEQTSSKKTKSNIRIKRLTNLPNNDLPLYEQFVFQALFRDKEYLGEVCKQQNKKLFRPRSLQEVFSLVDYHQYELKDEVETHDLKDSFYRAINIAKADLAEKVKPFYNQKLIKRGNRLGCAFSIMALIFASLIYVFTSSMPITMLVGFFILLLGALSTNSRKNVLGNEVLAQLKGFQQFISLADTQRIQSLLKEDKNYFEKTMGYAMAFGLLKDWTRQFEALSLPPPNWYHGSSLDDVDGEHFAQSLSDGLSAAQSSMVSAPSDSSSSGGGSSGGGAGGGGGGSW